MPLKTQPAHGKGISMAVQPDTLQLELAGIVGPAHLEQADPRHQVDGIQPRLVVHPGTPDEVAQLLALANAAGLSVTPYGGGSKLGWGNRPRRIDLLLSTRRLAALVEHASGDMTATVQAGCTIAELQRKLSEHGQRLALDPLWPDQATVGGILATNDSGALRLRFGALRDLILGVTVVLPDGTLAKSGGKVVKNVAGYDLPKLMTGALGTLGVLVDATFRLYPVASDSAIVRAHVPTMAAANALMLKILDSTMVPSSVQCQVGNALPPRVEVRFEGIGAAISAQLQQLHQLCAGSVGLSRQEFDATWSDREPLFRAGAPALVCKTSVLPSQIQALTSAVQRVAGPLKLEWELIAQAFGIGTLRLAGPNDEALLAALAVLRAAVKQLGGSLVVLACPLDVKARIDIWDAPRGTLPLMRRIKDYFDPNHILNPGRFVGF